jgi:hypothetical protein
VSGVEPSGSATREVSFSFRVGSWPRCISMASDVSDWFRDSESEVAYQPRIPDYCIHSDVV